MDQALKDVADIDLGPWWANPGRYRRPKCFGCPFVTDARASSSAYWRSILLDSETTHERNEFKDVIFWEHGTNGPGPVAHERRQFRSQTDMAGSQDPRRSRLVTSSCLTIHTGAEPPVWYGRFPAIPTKVCPQGSDDRTWHRSRGK